MRLLAVSLLAATMFAATPAMAQKNGTNGTTAVTGTGGANGVDEIVRRIERELDRIARDLERDVRHYERSRRAEPEQRSPQQPNN